MNEREEHQDWARQVPGSRSRGPYEDFGWEEGESVLPEFRKPDVHMTAAEFRRMRAERERNREQPEAPEFRWTGGESGSGPERRRGPFYGVGPRGYRRSDERIQDDIVFRLYQHGWIDAREIAVEVSDGVVTLRGIVDDRRQRRLAEDLAAAVLGVIDVNNDLKVRSLLRERQ